MTDKEQDELEATPSSPANAEVLPKERSGLGRFRGGWPYTPQLHLGATALSLLRWTIAIVWVGLVIGSSGIAFATYDYSKTYSGRILPGARVGHVDVGGMTREKALTTVRTAVQPLLDETFTLRWKDRTWEVKLRELGARAAVRDAVHSALSASNETTFVERARMRVLGSSEWFKSDVPIDYPTRALRGFLRGLASAFNQDARDATVDYSSGWVELVEERAGRRIRIPQTYSAVASAVSNGGREAELSVVAEKPTVTTDAFQQVLLLRIGENRLYLYENGEITHEWPVATGQPEYPTPTGIYEIVEKRYLPTWVNPDPQGWGADMPLSIPPGPGNPLGLRALNWSAPAIRFHGTSATYSLGYNASHGCVRMSNEDVIQLYDMIDVGTPIVSTVVAPLRPLYVSAPDPTVVAPDADSEEGDSAQDSGDSNEDGQDRQGRGKKNR